MKRTLSVLMAAVLLVMCTTTAFAFDFGDMLGGLTSLLSAEQKIYCVGEPAEVEDLTLELINVMQSSGNSYYKPENGNEYLIFEFKIKNNGREEAVISTILCFNAWVDDRSVELSLNALALATLSGKIQLDTVIEPGKEVTGVVAYEVSKNWKNVKVEFAEEFFGSRVAFGAEK